MVERSQSWSIGRCEGRCVGCEGRVVMMVCFGVNWRVVMIMRFGGTGFLIAICVCGLVGIRIFIISFPVSQPAIMILPAGITNCTSTVCTRSRFALLFVIFGMTFFVLPSMVSHVAGSMGIGALRDGAGEASCSHAAMVAKITKARWHGPHKA